MRPGKADAARHLFQPEAAGHVCLHDGKRLANAVVEPAGSVGRRRHLGLRHLDPVDQVVDHALDFIGGEIRGIVAAHQMLEQRCRQSAQAVVEGHRGFSEQRFAGPAAHPQRRPFGLEIESQEGAGVAVGKVMAVRLHRVHADKPVRAGTHFRLADHHPAWVAIEPDDDMRLGMSVRNQVARCVKHRDMPELPLEELDRSHLSSRHLLRVPGSILMGPILSVKLAAAAHCRHLGQCGQARNCFSAENEYLGTPNCPGTDHPYIAADGQKCDFRQAGMMER